MISYSEALEIILSYTDLITPEIIKIPIFDCLGMTLAEDIITDVDFPSFDNSAMDGYAVKYENGKSRWKVTDEITAGNFKVGKRADENAIKIMTGGKMPEDADTVIPIEDVRIENDEIILNCDAKIKKNNQVRFKGEYLKEGSVAIKNLTVLKPNHLTVAASCGYNELKVLRPLDIAVLSTGDELIPFNQTPIDDKIRSTNSFSLALLIKKSGMVPVLIENAKDNKVDIKSKIESAVSGNCDILVTSGGVSVGEHDYVQEVLKEIGAEIIFWKVNIKPGKPFLFSVIKRGKKSIPIFSFPGNPVSAFMNFHIFLKPFLDAIYHRPSEHFECKLKDDISKKDDKLNFVLGLYYLNSTKNKYIVEKAENQSSGNLISLGISNCLIIFNDDKKNLKKGESVRCIKL